MTEHKSDRILIIDDDDEIRYSLNRVLSSRGYEVEEASSGEAGIEAAKASIFQVIFLDNRMEGMSGLETLQHLRTAASESMVILMTAFGTTQTAIEAMKFGAFDYIIKPFDLKKVLDLTEKALQSFADLQKSRSGTAPLVNSEDYQEGIVGSSEPMQVVFKAIGQVATSNVTVMVTGESGTGKELVARCIHQHSLRSSKPFMAVNCAAIPDNLIESELFGHEKGSFTGATQQRIGKFELCDGGSLFLDEIGDMALPTQTKILRALQEGEIQRVGGEKTIKVDVRLIAATNRDLEKMVEEKSFREDLYYRLNVMRIRIPSLRDRLSDVPSLVDFMLQRLQKDRRMTVKRVSDEALRVMMQYSWPGNVRELENTIQRCVVIAQGDTVLKKDLPQEILEAVPDALTESSGKEGLKSPLQKEEVREELIGNQPQLSTLGLDALWDEVYQRMREGTDRQLLQAAEMEITRRVLKETGGNQVKASTLLGITRATLRKRIDSYGLADA
ncbi:sigma-54-dependent Fis family transcriptional regulator [Puniceicoccales bacterium CK1056]|uniref:DNA-binding transcriptional regulator NtrC n=1 Tax=Oceanipulchritudo coccoides TaxID=2706888 RepID=A0A6B2M0U5_9BACT|nr:sigma-54 dependent transcriptional regulator [Oceanipulchritudo coccoides]NDV62528.1 sigma-54-dependent Fis family transcriptional regulator [Oceanipulchritudo coccoides]